MAILPCLPGLKVTIEVDDEPATEYDADPEEVKKSAGQIDFFPTRQTFRLRRHGYPYVLKYIEAKPGELFSFVLDLTDFKIGFDKHTFNDGVTMEPKLHAEHWIDGYNTKGFRLIAGNRHELHSFTTGSDTKGWKQQSFGFAKLNVVEGSTAGTHQQAEQAKYYGTLIVKLFLSVNTDITIPYEEKPAPAAIISVGEKDMIKGRAVDAKVDFEAEPTNRPAQAPMAKSVDRKPIAVLEFRYRTMEGLHQELIVPRRPVVKSVEDDEDGKRTVKFEDKKAIKSDDDKFEHIKKYDEPSCSGVKREASTSSENMSPGPLDGGARNCKKRRVDEQRDW
ncbi:hypothetical protein B0T20DRAFT_220917 [Sordaria brevicollis]|uniref:DUF7918 domain-containing protein n=1 Tax=Sordaria brevicollis TaxID=83679 RepID=A0AAE0PCJ7_SORBR|nr:hypothetical protein B0T20DRAFT_220917 [Sordaria brevicollis]